MRSVEHLRDAHAEALGVSPAEIYRAIKRLPTQITRRGAARLLPEAQQELEQIFATHANVGPYRLRDVVMYGMAECRRSDMFAAVLRSGKLDNVAALMRISHDGDRVVRWASGRTVRHGPSYSDSRLNGLIRDVAGENPARRARAALWVQPGRYACSTRQIDAIVDLACAVDGVVGGQLAGAGLGGCAMILARTDAVASLVSALRRGYYRRRRLAFDVHVCRPVAGSGILNV